MKRVAVVGCSGAGKSTFCRKLSAINNLPVTHLDTYYHDKSKPYFEAQDLQAWESKVLELVSQDEWIMDGNFGSTFKQRFEAADIVIFFDYPRYLCLWRILKRRFEFHSKQRPEMPNDWQERFDYGFMRYVWNFKRVSRPKIISASRIANMQPIVFKHPRDAEKYLQGLKNVL